MRIENTNKIIQEPTTRTVGIDNEDYTVVVDATTGNAIKEARINAEEFNKAMQANAKLAQELVDSLKKLGPGKSSIETLTEKKLILDESLFASANKF